MKTSTIGVVGASGRLGGLVAEMAAGAGLEVVPISGRSIAAGKDDTDFSALEAVIIAAPLPSIHFHRRAIEAGCHAVDVGIVERTIREALALDGLARERERALVVMAGLAPGLTGLLGLSMAHRYPDADRIDVVLVQSAQGTAGERGVRDMLDMLSDAKASPITKLDATRPSIGAGSAVVFGLPSAERAVLEHDVDGPAIRYHTAFDAPSMNRTIRLLRHVRRFLPKLYERIRDRVAASKARRPSPAEEKARLAAIAVGTDGTALGRDELTVSSDYGATAKVAVALAQMAITEQLSPGVGHPAAFTDWQTFTGRAFE